MIRLLRNLFCSSLGRKYLMAVTGGVMFLFVIGHLVGNLQVFIGPDQINTYGHFLQSNLEIIWPGSILVLGCLPLHDVERRDCSRVYHLSSAPLHRHGAGGQYWSDGPGFPNPPRRSAAARYLPDDDPGRSEDRFLDMMR